VTLFETDRVWRLLYLAGASLAFAENRMGVHQVLLVRPDNAGRSGLPRGRSATLGHDPALDRVGPNGSPRAAAAEATR
jgi:cyclopropane-fatty-acyl-phospholipid synthase